MGEMIGLQDALSKALAKKDQRALNAVARCGLICVLASRFLDLSSIE